MYPMNFTLQCDDVIKNISYARCRDNLLAGDSFLIVINNRSLPKCVVLKQLSATEYSQSKPTIKLYTIFSNMHLKLK